MKKFLLLTLTLLSLSAASLVRANTVIVEELSSTPKLMVTEAMTVAHRHHCQGCRHPHRYRHYHGYHYYPNHHRHYRYYH